MKRRNKTTTLDQKQHELEVQAALKQNHIEYEQKLERHLKASPNHKRPVTRRDFLEIGFWSSSVTLLGPSLETLMNRLQPAYGATLDCPAPVASKSVPFVHFHIEGGTHPLGYITPRAADGSPLSNYNRLGLGAAPTFMTDAFANGAELFNNTVNGAGAGFYAGWMEATTPAIRANTTAHVMPWLDNGDGSFQYSIMGLVAASGQSGQKMGVIATTETRNNVATIPNLQSAYNIIPAAPLGVQNLASITNAVSFAGALNNLSQTQKQKLVRTIESLSATQKAKIMGISGGENAAKLIECATGQNVKNVDEGTGSVDPKTATQSAQLSTIWNNFQPLNTGGKTYNNDVNSLVVYNVANSNAAGAAIYIGDHDQHASHNNRTEQEQSAFAIAKQVGQSIATAALLGKKMMVQITMNGSCVNGGGTPTDKYDNDDNQGDCSGGSLVFFYDPAGVKTLGAPTIGGVVNSSDLGKNGRVDPTQVTSNVLLGQTALFYNYCLFRGDAASFENLLPGRLTAAQKIAVRRIGNY